MISEAAYSLAEGRGCEPGHALEDWLRAELQVKETLVGGRNEVASQALQGDSSTPTKRRSGR